MIDEKDTEDSQPIITRDIISPVVDKVIQGDLRSISSMKELESHFLHQLIQKSAGERSLPPFFKMNIREKIPPLSFYQPPPQKTIPPLRQGINGVIGIFLGAIAYRILSFALGLNDGSTGTTLFLTSIAGAFLFLYYQTTIASFPIFNRFLPSIIGIQEEELQREEIETSMEKSLSLWIALSQNVIQYELEKIERDESLSADKELKDLLPSLYRLYQSNQEELEVALFDLFAELKVLGYKGLEGEPTFLHKKDEELHFQWSNEFHNRYSCFGHIEEGELVKIEKPVIIQNDTVIQKGLVRLIRKTNNTEERCKQ